MSSYHTSFSYLGKSSKDMGWIIVAFDADEGATDSYLSQEQIYTDSYNGTRRILYGTKWDSVATVTISVVKQSGDDFTEKECRDTYKWLTGNPNATWLDLYNGDSLRYSFSVTTQNVQPYKLDARTVGMVITFESISPWAYSPEQTVPAPFGQALSIDDNGVLVNGNGDFIVDANGVLTGGDFSVGSDGMIYIQNATTFMINNETDDLYSYVWLETTFRSLGSDSLIIKNQTLYNKTNGIDGCTEISGISDNEIIKLSSGQFIISDIPNKIFGNTFNFIWPKLIPGYNEIIVDGSGNGIVEFKYRYPIKIGDCAIDTDVQGGGIECDSMIGSNTSTTGNIPWSNITDTPTTIGGYGIVDTYTVSEIDAKHTELTSEEIDKMFDA